MLKYALKLLIVDNRPGAGGSVGAEVVAKATGDGYTLLMSTNSPLTTNLALYRSLHYDTLRDFVPILLTGENGLVVVAHPSLPVKTFADLIALAKKLDAEEPERGGRGGPGGRGPGGPGGPGGRGPGGRASSPLEPPATARRRTSRSRRSTSAPALT